MMFYEKFAHSMVYAPGEELTIDFSSYKQSSLVEKMITKETAQKRLSNTGSFNQSDAVVRNLAQAIDRALHNHENPFHALIKRFKELFIDHYRIRIKDSDITCYDETSFAFLTVPVKLASSSLKASEIRREAVVNIEYFIKLMMFCVSLFYKPVIGEEKLIYLRELIVNSVLNIVIRDDVYNVLFLLLRIEHDLEEAAIAQRINEMKDIKPESLGINKYLCLIIFMIFPPESSS